MAEPRACVDLLAHPLDLVRLGRDRQLAGALEVAVDAVVARRSARSRRGSAAPSRSSAGHLVREAGQPVGQPVRQARRAEPAVAPGRRPAGGPRLEQHARRAPGRPPWPAARSTARCTRRRRPRGRPACRRRAAAAGAGASGESSQNEIGAASAQRRGCGHACFRPAVTAPTTATSTPNAKISVPITFTCGGTRRRALDGAVDPQREGHGVAVVEAGDDVVVDRQRERQQAAGHHAGHDHRQRDPEERRRPARRPRSRAASSSAGSMPAIRARTVTAT